MFLFSLLCFCALKNEKGIGERNAKRNGRAVKKESRQSKGRHQRLVLRFRKQKYSSAVALQPVQAQPGGQQASTRIFLLFEQFE